MSRSPVAGTYLPIGRRDRASGTVEEEPMRSTVPSLTMTVEEAAQALGISRTLAYELVARHQLPSVRLGRRIVVPRRALEALLEETASEPA